jgi:uncharacterized protein
MDQVITVLVGVAILIGLVGVVLPMLPGLTLQVAAVLVWALRRQDRAGWIVLALVVAVFAVGQVAKYLLPGRRLKRAGVPTSTLVAGALLGVVGFFVIPVVGVLVGFVLGIYLAELARMGSHAAAWPSTKQALTATGWSVLIELATGLIVAATWLVGAVAG